MIELLGSLYYYPIKLYLFVTGYLYFRKLRVVGRKNIPLKGPIIFAINHQNALLDALLLSSVSMRNPHFLTRSDVFKSGLIDKILRGAKMLPIYRIRDGISSVKMNAAIFESSCKILEKNGTLGIFPEGNDQLTYQLRTFKKGISRIAFMAEETADFKLGVKIIPIGIQYESHFFAKRTLISFGEPINVTDYKNAFLEDKNKAMDNMLANIKDRIKKLILTIDSENYKDVYDKFMEKRVFKIDLQEQLATDQALVDSIINGEEFEAVSDKKNLVWQTAENSWNMLWRLISFIPKLIVNFLVKKTADETHFTGTMRYVFTLFLYPVIFLLMYWVVRIFI